MYINNFNMYATLTSRLKYKNNDIFFDKYPKTKIENNENWNVYFKNKNSWPFENDLNNFGFRSDNFKKDHNGTHVLFNGCSNTFGVGLNKNEMWSTIVNDKIINNSGYFNLSIPGTSILNQIVNFFKYFNNYGNPDIIFFNMPDLIRFYSIKNDVYCDANYNDESLPILKLLAYQYYVMLEQYCISHNIKLYSFSWHEETESFMSLFFNSTFYNINNKNIAEKLEKYKNKDNEKYLITARDNTHFGIGFNLYWADFIYDKYFNDKP